MAPNWNGRPPISFTTTNYNDGTWGDSTPWSGIIVNGTTSTTRPAISGISYQYLIDASSNYLVDVSGEPLVALASSPGTPYTTRIIP